MQPINLKNVFTCFVLALMHLPALAGYVVTAYGKHEIDPVTKKKWAVYQYKVQNNGTSHNKPGAYAVAFTIGQRQIINDPLLDSRKVGSIYSPIENKIKIFSPKGWRGEIGRLEESYLYAIDWEMIDWDEPKSINRMALGIKPGTTMDSFIVKTAKADSTYVKTYAIIQGNDQIGVRRADTIAPKIKVPYTVNSSTGKEGWIEVVTTPQVVDDYDPYPVALLTKITSNQTLLPDDVVAVFDEETRNFQLKTAPNRTYTITYTGMDASGNKTTFLFSVKADK